MQPSKGFAGAPELLLASPCGLRRIPLHHAIVSNRSPGTTRRAGASGPGTRSAVRRRPELRQRHCGGKRIRIVGAGNIASHYASFVHTLC